jgi:PIN domain nuclease of toxin-antitoxin system
MAIKQSIGKLSFHLPFEEFITQQLSLNDFNLLEIKIEHLTVVSTLYQFEKRMQHIAKTPPQPSPW